LTLVQICEIVLITHHWNHHPIDDQSADRILGLQHDTIGSLREWQTALNSPAKEQR
jgi:hypothetical protein